MHLALEITIFTVVFSVWAPRPALFADGFFCVVGAFPIGVMLTHVIRCTPLLRKIGGNLLCNAVSVNGKLISEQWGGLARSSSKHPITGAACTGPRKPSPQKCRGECREEGREKWTAGRIAISLGFSKDSGLSALLPAVSPAVLSFSSQHSPLTSFIS